MGRYRKVDPRIWNDERFRALSDHAKLVFLFLLTHPHLTCLGAMRGTEAGLGQELGWVPKAFREAFREGLTKGLYKYDSDAACILLPKFLKYNGPESPNVVKSWAAALDLIPECELKSEVIHTVKAFAEALPKAFAEALPKAFAEALPKAFAEALPKTMPNQEQEQEQEQKKPPPSPPGGPSAWETVPWGTPEALAHLYNEVAPDNCPAVESLSTRRREKARAALRQFPDRAWWADCFREYQRSKFLSGKLPAAEGHKNFKPDFDWLLSNGKDGAENYVKVHDGRYSDD